MAIYVTKTFLPPLDKYENYLKQIWNRGYLTNQGPCLQELESKLKTYLSVPYLNVLTNGTIALQLALDALDIHEGEVITTPFSFVATTCSILWERCTPVFVDIEPDRLTINPKAIEAAITPKTKAIMAVHVFGYPCFIKEIQDIADKHGLKVIYDGAHAFGSIYQGQSLLSFGDVTTCSFHATKLFHTVEGGLCVEKDSSVARRLELAMKFGFEGDVYETVGVNAKMSELHAAMGLVNLPYLPEIIEKRRMISEIYDTKLNGHVRRPQIPEGLIYNYAYYPVIFESEEQLMRVMNVLKTHDIFPRRYFYPSLNTMSYLKQTQDCPQSQDISARILCLPLSTSLTSDEAEMISDDIIGAL